MRFPSQARTFACTAADDSVTHTTNDPKTDITVQWAPPQEDVGDIKFVATVVRERQSLWMDVTSEVVAQRTFKGMFLCKFFPNLAWWNKTQEGTD